MRFIWVVLAGLCLASGGVAMGQTAEEVVVPATDGLELAGDWYAPTTPGAPVVVLMHMLGSNRQAYAPLIEPLMDAGYAILNVDMRGHGATGGAQDFILAQADVQVWLAWLTEQDEVAADRVVLIGASIGSNLALIGCAESEQCVTIIALSPGLDYRGVQPAEAVAQGLMQRPVLLVAAQADRYSADSVRDLFAQGQGYIQARIYPGRNHGTQLFGPEGESLIQLILDWLAEHASPVEELMRR